VIDDLGQPGDSTFQRFLAILVEEELGIGQTRANDALVATDHGARIGRTDVADDEELVGQLAGRVEQREVLLVRLHGQDQAFLRYGEEFFLELANQHVRAFDQRSDFVEQGVVVDRPQRSGAISAGLGRSGFELADDFGTTFGEGRDHGTIGCQPGGIFVGIGQNDRIDPGFKAVTMGFTTCVQAEHRNRQDLVTMQRDQTMRRADEIDAAPAVLQLVGHDFRNRQRGQSGFQRLLQAFGQRRALGHAVVKQDVGLAVVLASQVRHAGGIGTQRGQLLQQGRGGVASSIEADGDRHQLLDNRLVGGHRGDLGDMSSQTARRGKSGDFCGQPG